MQVHRSYSPIPGYWYSMNANRLIQVRVVVYTKGLIDSVAIEDIDGNVTILTPIEWFEMKLVLHSPVQQSA